MVATIVSSSNLFARLCWAVSQCLLAAFFGYAACVQLNDPDWQIWFSGYAMSALVCLQLAFSCFVEEVSSLSSSSAMRLVLLPSPRNVAGTISILSTFFLMVHFYKEQTIDFSPRTEVGREASGLLIVIVWMFLSNTWQPSSLYQTSASGGEDKQKTPSLSVIILNLLLPIAASLVLWSVYYVPSYILHVSETVDHCAGLGFPGQLNGNNV
jgi:hypothetical protein